MNDQESYEFEDRRYVSPTLSSTEQADFIDNLRNVQAQNNAQIAQQTHDLGTQVPSNLGGLGGGESYFNARYQTPQANEIVSTLKAAAQAQELNDVMNNYKAQLQNRYKQKYREYEKAQRAYYARKNKQNNSGGNGGNNGNNGNNTSGWDGEVIDEVYDGTGDTGNNLIDRSKQWILDNYQKALENGTLREPPKKSDYQITGSEQNKRISDKTGIPEWLVNVMKIFG